MRLVIAECTLDYSGRLDTHLPRAVRLIIRKADGTVTVNADAGRQPLNWFPAPNDLNEAGDLWTLTNAKGERLVIQLHKILSDETVQLGDEPGLQKQGTEDELQTLLADRPEVLGEGVELVRREFPTSLGPVDLLCRDEEGTVAVEVKRSGGIDGVEQLTRYLDQLRGDIRLHPIRGIFAALTITPQAKTLAESRGIECREFDLDQLRGVESSDLKLF